MIAASGTRFDGLDFLYVFFAVFVVLVALQLLWHLYQQEQDKVRDTGLDKLTLNEIDDLVKTDYLALLKPNLNATPYFVSDKCSLPRMWSLMEDEWVYGISETPMPTPFYDWKNERPLPVVNW